MKIIEGWIQYEKAHFVVRGKRFWNRYPPGNEETGYLEMEGYYYEWKSLCGAHSFVAKISRKIEFDNVEELHNACSRCFEILQGRGKLPDVDLTFKPNGVLEIA